MPLASMSRAAAHASCAEGKELTPTAVSGMRGARRRVAATVIPSVPSEPRKIFVRSGPAEDLRERARVVITSPSGRTTVCAQSRMSVKD